jgi:serine phosphatase RsbU (regulator of sigma subunit)/tetratricopeptide (TPR) repeat protein
MFRFFYQYLFVVPFLLSPLTALSFHGENNKIDSLNRIINTISDDAKSIDLLNELAFEYYSQSRYKESIETLKKALELSEESGNKKGIAMSAGNLSIVYQELGSLELAIDLKFTSLKISEELKDSLGIARTLTSLGNIYSDQGLFSKAIKQHEDALKIFERYKDTSNIASTLSNLGAAYNENKDFDNALKYYDKALLLYQNLKDEKQVARMLNNIGANYYNQELWDEAMGYYKNALELREAIQDKVGIATTLINIAQVYLKKKDPENALYYAKKSLLLSKEIHVLRNISESYLVLSESYALKNNKTEELKYFKLYSQTKDSLLSENSANQLIKMSAIYEADKKQKEIELLNKEKEKQETIVIEQEKRKNLIIYSSTAIILVVVFFSIFLYRRYKVTKTQNKIIEEKNKDITDSINYAKKIQTSILPNDEDFRVAFPESFVLFKPKDIVSGDFYWISTNPNEFPAIDKAKGESWKVKNPLIAAVDCTGHGVPGSLMSMLGNSLLNKIVDTHKISKPNEILNALRTEIINSLKQHGENENKDGMDIALCVVYDDKIEYAGANNPIYIIRKNGALEEIKADKMPISYSGAELKPYTNHAVKVDKGDSFYIFTDGYADQFGGKEEKKFKYKQLKELLVSINSKPMENQKKILNETLEKWMGTAEQTDDILIIGVRV